MASRLSLWWIIFCLELSAGPNTHQYDAAGNTIAKQRGSARAQSLSYNSQNRIVAAIGPQGSGSYTYADAGSRLRKHAIVVPAASAQTSKNTELLHSGPYLSMESLGTGRSLVNHIYLNGVRIAAVAPGSPPAIRYYLTDQVSSTKITIDGTGNVFARHEYLPYGEEFSPTPDLERGLGGGAAPKFNSQEKDKESGLDFFNARHYDTDTAHFTSADTVIDGDVITQGWNRYMYTRGNPVKYSDPTGNFITIAGETTQDLDEQGVLKLAFASASKSTYFNNLMEDFKSEKADLFITTIAHYGEIQDASGAHVPMHPDAETGFRNTLGTTRKLNGRVYIFLNLDLIARHGGHSGPVTFGKILSHEGQHAHDKHHPSHRQTPTEVREYRAFMATAIYCAELGHFPLEENSPDNPLKATARHNAVRGNINAAHNVDIATATDPHLRNLQIWQMKEKAAGHTSGEPDVTPFNPRYDYLESKPMAISKKRGFDYEYYGKFRSPKKRGTDFQPY
jgi:RHS repeat-associated protein